MGSSQIVNAGRFSGGRSNFSKTCNLLSQYLKENGSFGDLSLGLNLIDSKETMNLLPMIEKSGTRNPNSRAAVLDELQKKSEPESAPMTIFYGGQVMVFNDFSVAKAEEIIMLASKSSCTVAAQNHHSAALSPPLVAQSPAESTTNIDKKQDQVANPSPQPALARKNSLARFLKKRKDRKAENAPYQTSKPAVAPPLKPVNSKSWLGLAPEFSL